jgi:transcriptional regulator with XRE-family HTH domain
MIKTLRRERHMNQMELAKGICSQAFISKVESGYKIPSTIILIQLADRLDVDINIFIEIFRNP